MAEALKSSILEYAFEGIDGGGKTTNIQQLQRYYSERNYNVVILLGLSQTDFGKAIRRNIVKLNSLGTGGIRFFKEDIRRSYASLDETPADILLWDRHLYSIYAANAALPDLNVIRRAEPLVPEPPKVFIMNVPADIAWMREQRAQKGDHPLTPEWLAARRTKYLELLHIEPERFIEIDATKPFNDVSSRLVSIIDEDLSRR